MRELNIEFQEHYKRLDKLCREMYSPDEGVTAYIQDMERTPYNEQIAVYNWENIYRSLKHYRWMRNQLAHDISIDSDFCEKSDIEWIKNFRESILSGNDPLTRAYHARRIVTQKRTVQAKTANENKIAQTEINEANPRESLWHRIVSKIKRWFS